MKRYLSFIALATILIVSMSSFMQLDVATFTGQRTAQEAGSEIGSSCGTDEVIMRNPFMQERYSNRVACAPEVDLDTAEVITIPVVIHILHLGEQIGDGTNISDEQAESCIRNLNERFRGDIEAMAEYTDVYGNIAFSEEELSLVIDSKIEFCLASRDPDNLPTNGIIRHDCSDLSYTNNFSGQTSTVTYAERGISTGSIYDIPLPGVPDSHIKELFHWPVDKYFNFYVVSEIEGNNAGNGIQGYSYVGSMGTGATGYRYGPVCLYNVTGDVGNLKDSRVMNATWAHEVGHALNLYHTFGLPGNVSSCDPETNSCSQGDQVQDTPPTSSNTVCSSPVCPDAMVENYMDYTQETCRTAFTQGQIERMREEIWTGLPYLVYENYSCQPLNSKDLAITGVYGLPETWCRDIVDFSVKISNLGGDIAEGASLLINGDVIDIPAIDGGEYTVLEFADYPLGDGAFDFEIIYSGDEYLDNNQTFKNILVDDMAYAEFAITSEFFASENSYELLDEEGNIIFEDGGFSAGQVTRYYNACLAEGCYTLKMYDSCGDGWPTGGGYAIYVNDELIEELYWPFNIGCGCTGNSNYAESEECWQEYSIEFCVSNCPTDQYCPEDINGDAVVDVHDLLEMLTYAGMILEDCDDRDLNNDFVIDGDDMFIVVQEFGLLCGTDQYVEGLEVPDWVWDYINGYGDSPTTGVSDMPDEQPVPVGRPVYYNLAGKPITLDNRAPSGIYIRVQQMSFGPAKIDKIFHAGGF